ncbi:MAG: alkaline phosphatase [Alphaproteobacteria bacterium]|jgi:alkaline phosphatase D|nr:alkaline phosphatase [Alphaproteobacteria bacterium]
MSRLLPPRPLDFTRRSLLQGAASAGLAVAGVPLLRISPVSAQFRDNPFTLGIASGEPAADGFVIWTRLAPRPLTARGGMAPVPVEVAWEIAADAPMQQVVRSGKAIARPEIAHSVHVEVAGLEPAREYYYRFRAGGAESPVGRARTLPAPGAPVSQLRFASAGCQEWEGGFFTAWRSIAEEAFDFVAHYGDYIYEHRHVTADRQGRVFPRTMPADFPLCLSLIDYRRRYALYKTDPDLQAAHAACCFLPSFDDHEVVDNWAADSDPKNTPPEIFLFRRAAAFQAWYEHMPVRRSMLPRGPDVLAYRLLRIGALADLAVLDTRQYRSKQPCGDGFRSDCKDADEPNRTMLGGAQERWLEQELRSAKGTWQVLAQQVVFSRLDWRSFPWLQVPDVEIRRMDTWDGASAGRSRVLNILDDVQAPNPVVLTGDAHMAMAFDIREDFGDPQSRCVGVEFLATSISSNGDGTPSVPNAEALHAHNPHLKFIGNERGYTRHVVSPKRWQADYRVVEKISVPGAATSTRKSFVVEAGRPGLMDA